MMTREGPGLPPFQGGISTGGFRNADATVSSVELHVGGSSSLNSTPSATCRFDSSSTTSRSSEGAPKNSSSSSSALSSGGATESGSSMFWRTSDQDRRARGARAGAATRDCAYATAAIGSHAAARASNAGAAGLLGEAADDNNSDLPSADELTLSGDDDFFAASPEPRSDSVSNRRLSSERRTTGSSGSHLSSSSGYENRSDRQPLQRGSTHPGANVCDHIASGGTSSSVESCVAVTASDRSTTTHERSNSSRPLWSSATTRSSICCGRSGRGPGVQSDAATEESTASHALEQLWKASASSFASSLSVGAVCTHSAPAERPLRAAATASQESPTASFDGMSLDGAARSSRSSTAQSSFSTVSNVSRATCSTSGSSVGCSSHAKGGGIFSPKASFCASAASSSSCGLAEGANAEGDGGAVRPAAAAYEARVVASLCGDANDSVAERADQQHGQAPRGGQSSLLPVDVAVLPSPSQEEEETCLFDESVDAQLSPDFLLSTTPYEEQLLQQQEQQHSSCSRSAGGGFPTHPVGGRSGCSYLGSSDPLRERERREARERQTLLLARQIVARFRAVHGTSAAADAVQLLQRYFHASRRHLRDTRSLERLAAACCYISARQKGGDSTSLFCLSDLAAELQPLPSNRRRGRGGVATPEQQETKLQQQEQQKTLQVDERERRERQEQRVPEGQRQRGGEQQRRRGEVPPGPQHEAEGVQQEEAPQGLLEPPQRQQDSEGWSDPAQARQTSQMTVPTSISQSDGEASAVRGLASVSSRSAGELAVGGTSLPGVASLGSDAPASHVESVMPGAGSAAAEASYPTGAPPFGTTAAVGDAVSAGAFCSSLAAGGAAATEGSQQSSKPQAGGHARCRTLARWIARVCRRLQLHELPRAEPDVFLRCNALLRRVRQLVEQRLEEQGEKTEERRAALMLVQQELQQEQQGRREQQQLALRGQQRRKVLDEGRSFPAEGADSGEASEGRGEHWVASGGGDKAKPMRSPGGAPPQQLGDGVGKGQCEGARTSGEVEDLDLMLLRSVFAGEGEEFFSFEKSQSAGEQPGDLGADEVAAALLSADSGGVVGAGTPAGAADAVEEKQQQKQQQEQEKQGDHLLAEGTGEQERAPGVVESKQRQSTVWPQGPQQKSKRSREGDEVRRLLSFEVSSDARQRSTAANSSRSDGSRGGGGYDFYAESSEGASGGSSNDDEPTTAATSAGDAAGGIKDSDLRAADTSQNTRWKQRSAVPDERNGGAWVADFSARRAVRSTGNGWGGAAAGAAEERSSSGQAHSISESDTLLKALARETAAAAAAQAAVASSRTGDGDAASPGQGAGSLQAPGNGMLGGGASVRFESPVASAGPASASSRERRQVCGGLTWDEGRSAAAGEFAGTASSGATSSEVVRHAAAAAGTAGGGLSTASASLRSANTPPAATPHSSSESLDRVLAVSSGAGGSSGDGDDSALLTLLAALGKSWGSTPTATAASAGEGPDSSGGEEGRSRATNEKPSGRGMPESNRGTPLEGAGSSPSPQYMQRVLHLHMKKSAWQQRCHMRALEKLKREREKVFRGLVLMYRVLTAVYNRSSCNAGSRSSHANNNSGAAASRTAAGAAGAGGGAAGTRADDLACCSGRSEDPLDGVWRARGRSDAVCMASLIILVFQWVQVVVPQRVVIDALHVDRKSVYTRRMEHMRILRALFRRLKKPDSVLLKDDEDDLAARFCEVLDSPTLSRQLLEVAEEGLCSSELVLILRRDTLPSLCVPALPQQQPQQEEQQKEKERQQSPQRQRLDLQQEHRSWRPPEHDVHPAEPLPQRVERAAGHQRGVTGGHADAASLLSTTQYRPRIERDEGLNRTASFAAVARAAVAAVAGEEAGAGATRRSAVDSCGGVNSKYYVSYSDTQAPLVRHDDEFLAIKKARREFHYSQRSSAAATASATASAAQLEGGLSADDGTTASASRSCDGDEEAAAACRTTAAAVLQFEEVGGAHLHIENERRRTAATASSPGGWVARVCCSAAGERTHAGSGEQAAAQSSSFASPSSLRKTEHREVPISLTAASSGGVKDAAETVTYSPAGSAGLSATRDGAADGRAAAVDAWNPSGTSEGERQTTKGRRAKTRTRGGQPQAFPSTEQLKLAKTAVLQSLPPAADVVSLQFERTQQRWVCKWLQSSGEGRAAGWKRRCFSVLKYGYDGAHQLAAAAATKLRDGRQRLQQQQQQQGKPVSKKCRRAPSAAAATVAASPVPT